MIQFNVEWLDLRAVSIFWSARKQIGICSNNLINLIIGDIIWKSYAASFFVRVSFCLRLARQLAALQEAVFPSKVGIQH